MSHQIKSMLFAKYRRFKWEISYLFTNKATMGNNKKNIAGEKILIIAPHADDELIGCYSIIKRYSPQLVCCSLTGSKNDLNNKRTREAEFTSLCSALCVEGKILNEDLENNICDIILELNPKLILIPSYIDWHIEHRMINEILYRFLLNFNYQCNIGWYQVSVPIPEIAVNHVEILLKEEENCKWDTFYEIYKSQKMINVERFKFYESHQCKSGNSEVFCILDHSQFISVIDDAKNILTDLDILKSRLNNICYIKRKTNELYSRVKHLVL